MRDRAPPGRGGRDVRPDAVEALRRPKTWLTAGMLAACLAAGGCSATSHRPAPTGAAVATRPAGGERRRESPAAALPAPDLRDPLAGGAVPAPPATARTVGTSDETRSPPASSAAAPASSAAAPATDRHSFPDPSPAGGEAGSSSRSLPATPRRAPALASTPGGPEPAAPPASPRRELERRPPPATASAERCRRWVDQHLSRLCSAFPEARKAFREFLHVPAHLIPYYIERVEDRRVSSLDELDVWARQKDLVRVDEEEGRYYYFLRGMGRFAFDDIAAGRARGRRGYRVRLRNFGKGFPLGVVVRAGLLNRLWPRPAPTFSDRDLERWWRAYYDLIEERP